MEYLLLRSDFSSCKNIESTCFFTFKYTGYCSRFYLKHCIFTGMRTLILLVCLSLSGLTALSQKNFHDFVVNDISGNPVSLAAYKGKKVLVVNTASRCGYTPQYAELENLYRKYAEKGFVILAFPCNDFGGQEPGSGDEIAGFCKEKYGVTFPLFEKVKIKEPNRDPLYAWLCSGGGGKLGPIEVKWNFWKFLIDENGNLVASFSSKVSPDSEEILKFLDK